MSSRIRVGACVRMMMCPPSGCEARILRLDRGRRVRLSSNSIAPQLWIAQVNVRLRCWAEGAARSRPPWTILRICLRRVPRDLFS